MLFRILKIELEKNKHIKTSKMSSGQNYIKDDSALCPPECEEVIFKKKWNWFPKIKCREFLLKIARTIADLFLSLGAARNYILITETGKNM